MSYIRASSKYNYVKGKNKDYVWSDGVHVIDYGGIADATLVELLHRYWKTDEPEFKDYLLYRLSQRLNVKLKRIPNKRGLKSINHRENKPLTKKDIDNLRKFNKRVKGILDKSKNKYNLNAQ